MKIAFGDKSRVGKDTAATYMISRYGGRRFSFANRLYKIMNFIQDLCGLPREKDRKMLQILGTEWGRDKDPDLWVNLTLEDIESSKKLYGDENYYITDVRFRNEFDRLKREGWIMIKITRNVSTSKIGGVNNHSSESNNIKDEEWNYVINNDEDVTKFYRTLDNIYVLENLMKVIEK